MKHLLLLIASLFFVKANAQQRFEIVPLSLPPELSFHNNQFSGLSTRGDQLFLMSESRLQDRAAAKLYAIRLPDLEQKIKDSSYVLPFRKYPIYGLEQLRDQMKAENQDYEGLEAIVIRGKEVYLTVETATPSPNCYLLKGSLNDTAVIMQPGFLVSISKPTDNTKAPIYNAGYEALTLDGNDLYAFFEFNYFGNGNYVHRFDTRLLPNKKRHMQLPVQKLPFRITDITPSGKHHFTAINYFFKGEGGDEVYRTPVNDTANSNRIRTASGEYKNYCRLIDIHMNKMQFTWTPLWEFPEAYMSYNWEGITAYRNGYFIINDKYTPQRPYSSVLLYLRKVK